MTSKIKFLLIFLLFNFAINSTAQCKSFAEVQAEKLLGNYIQSGRYNALKLDEGDEMLMYKTLSPGLNYRFIVIGSSDLPANIEFKVLDWNKNVLFDNKKNNYVNHWDFKSAQNQRVRIWVKVPLVNESKRPLRGCIAIITGFKRSSK